MGLRSIPSQLFQPLVREVVPWLGLVLESGVESTLVVAAYAQTQCKEEEKAGVGFVEA